MPQTTVFMYNNDNNLELVWGSPSLNISTAKLRNMKTEVIKEEYDSGLMSFELFGFYEFWTHFMSFELIHGIGLLMIFVTRYSWKHLCCSSWLSPVLQDIDLQAFTITSFANDVFFN